MSTDGRMQFVVRSRCHGAKKARSRLLAQASRREHSNCPHGHWLVADAFWPGMWPRPYLYRRNRARPSERRHRCARQTCSGLGRRGQRAFNAARSSAAFDIRFVAQAQFLGDRRALPSFAGTKVARKYDETGLGCVAAPVPVTYVSGLFCYLCPRPLNLLWRPLYEPSCMRIRVNVLDISKAG